MEQRVESSSVLVFEGRFFNGYVETGTPEEFICGGLVVASDIVVY